MDRGQGGGARRVARRGREAGHSAPGRGGPRRTLAVAGSGRRARTRGGRRRRERRAGGGEERGVSERAMLAAFEGWNDAADAATGAIEHLEREWHAKPFAAIDPEDYYDYQVNRPTIRLVDGIARRIEWPSTRLSVSSQAGDREVVLLRGLEPNMRWRAFCEEIIDFTHELDVDSIVCLAALLADVPHTRPIEVHGSASDEETATALGFTRSRYEGPVG